MSKVKANYEMISDKTQNPVTTTEYIKHGNEWLDTLITTALSNPTIIDLKGETLNLYATKELENVILGNGKIKMGTSADHSPQYDVALLVGSNVTIENVEFDNCDVAYVILTKKKSDRIVIRNNKFIGTTFNNIYFEVGNSNIIVENNYFDGIKWTDRTTFAYRYHIASGSRKLASENTDVAFMVKNYAVRNNVVKNNPYWEGIDCHGGENVIIENNYCENVRTGIMCALDTRFIATPVNRNISVVNNVIVANTTESATGIVAGGDQNIDYMAENIIIANNKVHGFNSVNQYEAPIRIRSCKNTEIKNNVITGNPINGILFGGFTYNTKVFNNDICATSDGVIKINTYANINVEIKNNRIDGLSKASYPLYVTRPTKLEFIGNTIMDCTRGYDCNDKSYIAIPSVGIKSYVDYLQEITTIDNAETYYSSTKGLCLTTDFDKVYSVSGTAGNDYVTSEELPNLIVDGMCVKIGDDVYTVKKRYATKLILDRELDNSYSSKSIVPLKPTFVKKVSTAYALQGKNILNIEKLLSDRNVTFTKNGDEYTFSTNSTLFNNKFYFSDFDIPVIITGQLTNVTSSAARISLINRNGEIVNPYSIDAGHSKSINTVSGLFFNWSTPGELKLNQIMIRRSDVTGDEYEEYKPNLQDQIDELKKKVDALSNG